VQNLRSRSLALGTLALLVVMGLILDELGALAPLEGLFLQLTTPIQRLVDSATERVIDANSSLRDLRDLRSRNEQLESLVDQLMIENVRLKEAEAQNEDLRRKLDFRETHPQYILKAAEVRGRVIGSEPTNFMSVLIIDIGTQDGIDKGMPVVTERGLVGRIQKVGTNWSKVLLVVDPSSSVAALVQSSRAPGLVSGRLGGELMMTYVPQEETISIGDVILTSGMSGNYPKGLVIGQVTTVEQRDIDTFQSASVRPSVEFDGLETVLVITTFAPVDIEGAATGDLTTEPAAEQDATIVPDETATPVP
jgi:rod shape-determining protein MreC